MNLIIFASYLMAVTQNLIIFTVNDSICTFQSIAVATYFVGLTLNPVLTPYDAITIAIYAVQFT